MKMRFKATKFAAELYLRKPGVSLGSKFIYDGIRCL